MGSFNTGHCERSTLMAGVSVAIRILGIVSIALLMVTSTAHAAYCKSITDPAARLAATYRLHCAPDARGDKNIEDHCPGLIKAYGGR